MNLQDFVKLLRTRWMTVGVTMLLCVLAALLITMLTTPLYNASTRLYVSTSAGSTAGELYQGNRLSQERVRSYTELLTGETLAQRTVDKLGLDMTASELRHHVSAKAKIDTVLIDVDVLDKSPVRARDIANGLSDEFVAMVAELETPKPGAAPDARVIVEQHASVPSQPVIPRTKRNIGIGLTLGLLLGIGLALLRDLLDNTVKEPETLESITGVGVVGAIPLDKTRRDSPAISFDTANTGIAEAFRKLRTNLQFLSVDHPPRLMVITSSAPQEGKSTTSINIALALAEAEHNVVLVDGDMRRPALHKYLDLLGTVGFSTVLSGAVTLDEALQKSAYPNLTVLTSGAVPPNPSELLGSTTAKNVLSELRSRFDYVIIDSPPLVAVTDGAILAVKADGVLVISRFGTTKREQLAHAIETLQNVGALVLGSILTMMPTSGASGYRYRYGYNYNYYGESTRDKRPSDPDILLGDDFHTADETAYDDGLIETSETSDLADVKRSLRGGREDLE